MKTIKVKDVTGIPKYFTGIVEWPDGPKYWCKEGKLHREDGPAIENKYGFKSWYLEGKCYYEINLKNFIILDYYKGKYDFMWYKLLSKDKVFECPDIPGLITK